MAGFFDTPVVGGALTAEEQAAIDTVDVAPTGADYAVPESSGMTNTNGGGEAMTVTDSEIGPERRWLLSRPVETADHMARLDEDLSSTVTIVAAIMMTAALDGFPQVSLHARDSATGKMVVVGLGLDGSRRIVGFAAKYSSDTAYAGGPDAASRDVLVAIGRPYYVMLTGLGTGTITAWIYIGKGRPSGEADPRWTSLGDFTASGYNSTLDRIGVGMLSTYASGGSYPIKAEVTRYFKVGGA